MRRPPASMLGDAADGAEAPPTLQASGGAPPPLAGAKKSLGDPVGPSKFRIQYRLTIDRFAAGKSVWTDRHRDTDRQQAARGANSVDRPRCQPGHPQKGRFRPSCRCADFCWPYESTGTRQKHFVPCMLASQLLLFGEPAAVWRSNAHQRLASRVSWPAGAASATTALCSATQPGGT
jgi:hypothetical protein